MPISHLLDHFVTPVDGLVVAKAFTCGASAPYSGNVTESTGAKERVAPRLTDLSQSAANPWRSIFGATRGPSLLGHAACQPIH